MYDVIIVGGGAAGLYAAAHLAKYNMEAPRSEVSGSFGKSGAAGSLTPARSGLSVLVLEKMRRPGSKILVSGSGQCNLTHGGSIKDFVNCYGDYGKKIRKVLYSHNNDDVREFFETLGVKTFERDDGKVFPVSLNAEDVRSALVNYAAKGGCVIKTDSPVSGIEIDADGSYAVYVSSQSTAKSCTNKNVADNSIKRSAGNSAEAIGCNASGENSLHQTVFKARNVIIACGGLSYPGTGSDGSIFPVLETLGLEIVPQRPALAPIHVNDYPYGELSGISFEDVELRLEGRKPLSGYFLFTHKELSGPLIINASRYIKPGDKIALSYMPAVNTQDLARELKAQAQGSKKNVETFVSDVCEALGYRLPKRFIEVILQRTEQELSQTTLNSSGGFSSSRLNACLPSKTTAKSTTSKNNTTTKARDNVRLLNGKAAGTSGKAFDYIAMLLTNDTFTVNSLGSYHLAMVTTGGVALNEIDLSTMQSHKYKGLYIIGETLDIDGDTGGYNLQFAFSGAYATVQNLINVL